MNLARARERIAALEADGRITAAEADELSNLVTPDGEIKARAYRYRIALQQRSPPWSRESAIRAAVQVFKNFVTNATALENEVRSPNGPTKKKSAIPESRFR
jgi:hypothetical protein